MSEIETVTPNSYSGAYSRIDDILEGGESYLASLESRADQWKSFAEEQYTAITDLLNNWEDPTAITTSLPEISIDLDPVGTVESVDFTADSIEHVPSEDMSENYNAVGDSVGTTDHDLSTHMDPDALTDNTIADTPSLSTEEPTGGIDFAFDETLVGPLPTITDLPTVEDPESFYGDLMPDDTALDALVTDFELPEMDAFEAPEFTAEEPTHNETAPEAMSFSDESFTHTEGFKAMVIKVLESGDSMVETLCSKITTDLEDGSSGIDPVVEQAIYDRAVSRMDDDYDTKEAELSEYFAARGFQMPPGAQVSAIQELNNKRGQALTELNNDIVVQRSNLTQQNLQALLQSGTQLQGVVLTAASQIEDLFLRAHNDMQNRAFETQKAIAEHALEVYRAGVEKYKADQERYKAMAQKYGEDIKLEIAKADVFRTQMEGVKAQAAASELIVNAYNAKLSKAKLLTEAYDAQTSMLSAVSAAERIKLDVYRGKIDAVTLGIEKYKAEWQAYANRSEGEKAKVMEWETSLKKAEHTLNEWNTQRESDVKVAGIKMEENRAKLEELKLQLETLKARDNQAMERLSRLDNHDEIRAKIHAINEENKFKSQENTIRNNTLKVEQAKAESSHNIAEMQAELSAKIEEYKMQQEKLKAESSVMAQIAASALSTMNNSLSYGHSSSISGSAGMSDSQSTSFADSASWVESFSNSYSESESTSHNYNYDE